MAVAAARAAAAGLLLLVSSKQVLPQAPASDRLVGGLAQDIQA